MLTQGIHTVAELARRLQSNRPTLHRLLYQESDTVDAATLLRVSDAVNLSFRWLLYGTGSPNKPAYVTPGVAQLVELYNSMPCTQKTILIRCATDLSDSSA